MVKKIILTLPIAGIFGLLFGVAGLSALELEHHQIYKLKEDMSVEDIMQIAYFNVYTKFAHDYQSTGYVHLVEKSGTKRTRTFLRQRIILGKEEIDYKDSVQLRSYISDRGKLEPRRKTGTCARHQRLLAGAIKRARHLALLPYVSEHIRKTGSVGLRD